VGIVYQTKNVDKMHFQPQKSPQIKVY
jgi:hypothetical protein